jgi:hypothetical protein
VSDKEFFIRIGQDEMSRILDMKENLDYKGLLLEFVDRYLSLGWDLVAMEGTGGTDLNLDFSQSREFWSQKLADLSPEADQINVGIRTGKFSRLLVLEVNRGEGALSLDQLGDWRSDCIAEMGENREQHYYTLPPERLAPPSYFLAPQVLIYGEGGVVLAPPSLEARGREPWRWRCPPWEKPPRHPQPAVWQFIRDHVAPAAEAGNEPQVLPWEQIYRVISPYGMVLKALLVPSPSPEAYYYGVLTTALGVGIADPEVLLGLLWHAPHGDCRTRAGRWEYLQDLVAATPMAPLGENNLSDLYHVPDLPAAIAALGAWSFPEKAWTDEMPPGAGPWRSGSKPETWPEWFDPSVSGQFFRLLAGLGEKVITESCRYEALRSGRDRPGEPRRLAKEWDQRYCPALPGSGEAPVPGDRNATSGGDLAQAWVAVMPSQAQQNEQLQEIHAAAQDFLGRNPDLASDRQKILMVIFCLKNYIAINPESAILSFREKLEKAGKMARVFLWEKEASLVAP